MTIYQLLFWIIGAVILHLLIRNFNEKYAVFISLGCGILIIFFICQKLFPIVGFLEKLRDAAKIKNQYFEVILKGIAICYLSEFAMGICKDCGLQGWVDKIELACKCAILVMSVPLLEEFLEVIVGLMK